MTSAPSDPLTTDPLTVVENASKRFRQGNREVDALQGVDLRVQAGSFVAVMGASGSGKSTLMHLMAGLTRPSTGTITVAGQDLAELSDFAMTDFRRRRIGLVFQAFNLIPALTAADNILLPLRAAGNAAGGEQVMEELATRLGIRERLSHRPDSLSGGEQQRVAIARALITDPAIVLADEPTGSLDSVTSESICELLRDLCDQQQRTIVVVTHEPSVAVWADQVVVLKDGRIVDQFSAREHDDAQALAAHYQHTLGAAAQHSESVSGVSLDHVAC
ncbi:ABC transporter ATP-binding protein [Stieleria sp. TO1_6]|uniref:ABC transporter ATP-binding protein n=1 Tax=Stieleria tagensis TaxID=2956795 RepID=UPI00209B9E29|nr:ABC transporter ATP-binding protein [Stieleria tagensis]MCO8125121.1 ABC transporter ATP-binding protein [Stieleria tagensis]